MQSYRVANLVGSHPFWYLATSLWASCPMKLSLVGAECSNMVSQSGSKVVSLVIFCLEVLIYRWDLREEGRSGIHGNHLPHRRSSPGRLEESSLSLHLPSRCTLRLLLRLPRADGYTPPSASSY